MKYFICGDVHGNVRAFDAVLAGYRREFPCEFLFLGDCIGYGAHPDACLDRVLNLPRARLLLGNHESALFDMEERDQMNVIAAEALGWSESLIRGRYGEEIRARFVTFVEERKLIAAHGSPVDPENWTYIYTCHGAGEIFYKFDFHVCFIGHTHQPLLCSLVGGEIPFIEEEPVHADMADRYIINPGSVGQPRDGDTRAAYCVFDTEDGTITLHRCEYDVEAEAEDIIRAGLPRFLGERLLRGE